MENYYTLKEKLSSLVGQQSPEYIQSEHPGFTEFVKSYFVFMESAEMQVTDISEQDEILLETENAALTDRIINEDGSAPLLESNGFASAFTLGEIITGQTTGATSTVLSPDISNSKLFISANSRFKTGETITGATSGATAKVSKYRGNPVQNIQQFLNLADSDKTLFDFLSDMRKSFMSGITENLFTDVDKRKAMKNIKGLYRAKGTAKANKLFFQMLFNETPDIYYPNRDLLKPSIGKFSSKSILRVLQTSGNVLNLTGQTITMTSGTDIATALVENVTAFGIGGIFLYELELNAETIIGTFLENATISGVDNIDETQVAKGTIKKILENVNVVNDGHLYTTDSPVTLSGGSGSGATALIEEIGLGGLDEIIVSNGGANYAVGDTITFNYTNSGGASAEAVVAVVNGGFAGETGTSADHIVLEDGTQAGDPYQGDKIVQEAGTSATKDITDIRITRSGEGMGSLPTATVTSDSGSGAVIKTYGSQIGRIKKFQILDQGISYSSAPTVVLEGNAIFKTSTGTVSASETFTGSGSTTGTLKTIDTSTNRISFTTASGAVVVGQTLTFSGSGTVIIEKVDQATATTTINTKVLTTGAYTTQDGFISEKDKRVQDSLYYQDYSYVVKVGESITKWRDYIKKAIHPSGFAVSGLVRIQNKVSGQISVPVEGIVSGILDTPIFSTYKFLFSTVFGRRAGTPTGGTSLRANPMVGNDNRNTHTANTRDVTVNRKLTVKIVGNAEDFGFKIRGQVRKYGFAYAGPRLKNAFQFGLFSGPYINGTGVPVTQWGNYKLSGMLDSSLNGTTLTLAELNDPANNSRNLKTNIAFPIEFSKTVGDFSTTTRTFDSTSSTFDEDDLT
jgi:hypothetical protein